MYQRCVHPTYESSDSPCQGDFLVSVPSKVYIYLVPLLVIG